MPGMGGGSAPGGVAWSGGSTPGGHLLETPPDGHCCWRNASFWNAFLSVSVFCLCSCHTAVIGCAKYEVIVF